MSEFKIRCQAEPWMDEVSFALFVDGSPVTVEKIEPIKTGMRIVPFATLTLLDAQKLFNELWQIGLRPTDDIGSVGELRATKGHLEDMRKIVADKLKVAL